MNLNNYWYRHLFFTVSFAILSLFYPSFIPTTLVMLFSVFFDIMLNIRKKTHGKINKDEAKLWVFSGMSLVCLFSVSLIYALNGGKGLAYNEINFWSALLLVLILSLIIYKTSLGIKKMVYSKD